MKRTPVLTTGECQPEILIKTYESKGLTPHLTTHHEINCV